MFVLRKKTDESNPGLSDAYGTQQTKGRLVYWYFAGGRTYFLVLFCRGGKYGCDGLNFFRYKGASIPEFAGGGTDEAARNWRFHPGTVTSQVALKNFTADAAAAVLTAAAHGYTSGAPVRIRSAGGAVPTGLSANAKYYVINSAANTFQLSESVGGAVKAFSSAGSGTLKVWQANAGFDDPVQGRPQFFPELNLTFSNVCYVEGIIPVTYSEDAEPTEFQFGLRCRRVADYDAAGNYTGNSFSANNARVYADVLFNELKRPLSRLDFASWFAFKQSCETLIWYRTAANASAAGSGLTGRYYDDLTFTHLVATRTDAEIDLIYADGGSPVAGVNSDNFSVVWEGKIKPPHLSGDETVTFKLLHNDGVKLTVNNQLIIDRMPPIAGAGGVGTHTGEISLTGGVLYNIKVEFINFLGGECKLSWSSPSQIEQVVPTNKLYPSDAQVKRYQAHVVFTSATQAGAALESVMRRAPGWHVQDVGGVLKFLPPDRAVAHRFVYDPAAQGERFNIAAKTFEANPRPSDERPNFRINYYNDLDGELLAEKWTESDRPNLRERQGGLPTDSSPARWGVMTRSLVERCGEDEMKTFSDPDRDFTLRGMADSYHVSKGDRVLLSHTATGESFAAPVECLVVAESFNTGGADEKSYSLSPRVFPLITDEPV